MMEQFKQNDPLSRSLWKKDRQKAQEWAKNAETEFRMKGREVGEQFRRAGIVLHDFARKILELDLEDPAVKELSDEQFMLSWLSWYKFGKTWRQLQQARSAGNWKASQQRLAVLRDHEKWKFGKVDPNDMSFKMDRPHIILMALGLDFGLDKLTLNELTDCFDAVCACGIEQSVHVETTVSTLLSSSGRASAEPSSNSTRAFAFATASRAIVSSLTEGSMPRIV